MVWSHNSNFYRHYLLLIVFYKFNFFVPVTDYYKKSTFREHHVIAFSISLLSFYKKLTIQIKAIVSTAPYLGLFMKFPRYRACLPLY